MNAGRDIWTIAVENSHSIDEAEVSRALDLICDWGSAIQVQSLPSGQFRTMTEPSMEAVVDAVRQLGEGKGTYVVLNPIVGSPDKMVRNADIARRRWLLVDVDAVKTVKDASTTDAEKAAALAVASAIFLHLRDLGWPDPLFVDSGNNWQLLYRIDLPNDDAARDLVSKVLKTLGRMFDSDAAHVDPAVCDARRICKIPGTMTRKGENTPERPWRMAQIAKEPDALDPVPRVLMETLIAPTERNGQDHAEPWKMRIGQSTTTGAYGRAAREGELTAVLTCTQDRNKRLYEAALKLGSLWAAGLLDVDEGDAQRQLEAAGAACHLGQDDDPGEITRAIKNGWTVGSANPRPRPATVGTMIAEAKPKSEDPEFSLGIIRSAEFFAEKPDPHWLVKGVIIAGQPLIIAGPMKSLKTSIALDLHVSLGTGCPFLGKWEVPKPIRTCFISGETGEYVLRSNAIQICCTRGVTYSTDRNMLWGSTLPNFNDPAHHTLLRKTIEGEGIQHLCFDPLYLCMRSSDGSFDHKNMFHMGPLLAEINAICQESDCTLSLVHHFPKSRAEPFAPPELTEVAYGGVSQWARQWLLLAKQARYDATTGLHRLHFLYGGSFGHAGEYSLEINTGLVGADFAGRKWDVLIRTPGEEGAAKQEQSQVKAIEKATVRRATKSAADEAVERLDMAQAVRLFRKADSFRLTEGKLRTLTNWRFDKAKRILHLLLEVGFIRTVPGTVKIGSGAARNNVDIYELTESERNVE